MAARSAQSRSAMATRGRSRGRSVFRRRVLGFAIIIVLVGGIGYAISHPIEKGYREFAVPLRHDDIIRQQARQKDLDPALIAAVIYQESRFRDQTSHAGARGLMQITPQTADAIAKHSGGVRFKQEDLSDPQINISYGAYYLRLLIDHYGGNETLAIAAYNAGIGNVDRWVASAGGADNFRTVEHIPFPETRAYVENVLQRREDYRNNYA